MDSKYLSSMWSEVTLLSKELPPWDKCRWYIEKSTILFRAIKKLYARIIENIFIIRNMRKECGWLCLKCQEESCQKASLAFKSGAFIDCSICVTGMKLQMSVGAFSLWGKKMGQFHPFITQHWWTEMIVWLGRWNFSLKCFDISNSGVCFNQWTGMSPKTGL